jgi:hypothetical protein
MFNSDDLEHKSLHAAMKEEGRIREVIKVDALYLFHQENDLSIDSVSSLALRGIPDFKGLYKWKDKDKNKMEQLLKDNHDRYLPIINAAEIRLRTEGMHYQLNQINDEIYSPWELEYRVITESLDKFDSIEKAPIDPAVVLVNISVGTGYDTNVRSQISQFAQKREIPLVIYASNGRDDDAAKKFEQIKKEWNASCGFVAGDAQWDGILSVAETMFGFMGEPARDWLYDHPSVRKAIVKHHNQSRSSSVQ